MWLSFISVAMVCVARNIVFHLLPGGPLGVGSYTAYMTYEMESKRAIFSSSNACFSDL